MDAVLILIYMMKEDFLQEGWHYELENKDGELTYNGVVYNEMKRRLFISGRHNG